MGKYSPETGRRTMLSSSCREQEREGCNLSLSHLIPWQVSRLPLATGSRFLAGFSVELPKLLNSFSGHAGGAAGRGGDSGFKGQEASRSYCQFSSKEESWRSTVILFQDQESVRNGVNLLIGNSQGK